MTSLIRRPIPLKAQMMLEQSGVDPLLARLYAGEIHRP
jgi:hypothetical protein